ncbi:glycosyltransferase family 2 protein [Sinomonas sp. RB5]
MKCAVIIACHNRRELTLRSVDHALISARDSDVEASFIVFDDGSTDGTADALKSLPADITILPGDGSAYWAQGMAQAEEVALRRSPDRSDSFILWLNDDVILDRHAFALLEQTSKSHPDAVLVGATREPETGAISYSGLARKGSHPLKFELVQPNGGHQAVYSFNGNVVLVPIRIARDIGGIDGTYSHAFADIDYGVRCKQLGVPVILTSTTVGTCARGERPVNPNPKAAWHEFVGAKGGGNFGSLRRVIRLTHPRIWPVYILRTYIIWWLRAISRAARMWIQH